VTRDKKVRNRCPGGKNRVDTGVKTKPPRAALLDESCKKNLEAGKEKEKAEKGNPITGPVRGDRGKNGPGSILPRVRGGVVGGA